VVPAEGHGLAVAPAGGEVEDAEEAGVPRSRGRRRGRDLHCSRGRRRGLHQTRRRKGGD
jgi:hypothetical protein